MFYAVSKVVWFLLQPSTLLWAMLAVAAALIGMGRIRAGQKWLLGGLSGLAFAGLTPLSDVLLLPLEVQFQRPVLRDIDGIIVLGGLEDGRSSSNRELMALGDASERLTEAAALARRYPKARIVISGGSDELLRTKRPEAETAAQLLQALGIEPSRIAIEASSRNTAENASFSKAVAAPAAGEVWLLVTSAWHMPRAMGSFRTAGFAVQPWPVDYRTPAPFELTRFHANIGEGLRRLDFITKEWVGLAVYRITGRTSSFLPGPT